MEITCYDIQCCRVAFDAGCIPIREHVEQLSKLKKKKTHSYIDHSQILVCNIQRYTSI